MFLWRKAVPAVMLSVAIGVLVSAQTAPRPTVTPPAPAFKPSTGPRRIEILFLGHTSTHHDSTRFAPMLKAALAQDGFNFSYTTDLNDLNAANLAKYDALMIYANYDKIEPAQEKALLDFVAGGKGFLPIHSASYCFRNSDAYISLVGALFDHHGTGEFTTTFVNTTHPVMEGLQPFQVWDETYVHVRHNDDRTVLMTRDDASGKEPWTWVRNYGKGRVFYTAYGHDERVWNHPMFHKLIKNAILWSIDPAVKAEWAALNIQPLKYTDPPVPIPNYERRPNAPKLQEPLSTDEAAKHFQIPPGFELQLFASEPMISGNPEALAWDEKGRLWVAETRDYPNNLQPSGQGHDDIKILEDTDHDGKADKATIFADHLSIPSSIVFANGGVIIAQGGEFLALKDTDGDDKADLRETLMGGWGTRDTHALASNLKYGLDNWIWGAVGYSGYQGNVGGKDLNFNQALYRLSPDGRVMQHMANFTNNTWGLAFDETFNIFGSTANNEHSVYVAIPRPYYDGVQGLRGDGKKKIDGHYAMQANTQKIRQVDSQGGFTAAAGHNFYTARAFPEEYWNRIAFVNEPTGHVVHRAIITPKGSGFAESDGWNAVASDDEWYAPVHAEVGPDGALWFADFYDFIVQHNPTPGGVTTGGYQYQNGKGNAYDTPIRESSHGRIYRLVYKGAKPYTPISLSKSRPEELVATLKNDNMFWRTTAQRLLVERGKTDVLPELYAIVNARTVDRIGLNSPAVHALYTMQGLGALDGKNADALAVARHALTHPAAGVRKAAESVLPKTDASTTALLAAGALKDKDLNARLNAVLVLSTMPASKDAGRAIYLAGKAQENVDDEWLPEALWIAAARHQDGYLQAYADEVGLREFTRVSVRGARGERDPGVDWSAPGLADTDWTNIQAPRIWSDTALGEHLGVIWFRRTIDLPAAAAGKAAYIRLGTVDDTDATYINGSRIGAMANNTNAVRQYAIPAGVLVAGRNVIAVRISNARGRGGFVPDPPPPAPGTPPAPPPPNAPVPPGPALTGMVIAGDGFDVSIAGQWKDKIEETWEGGRRREISPSVPLAQQYLLANSPVADILKPPPAPAPAGRGAGPGGGAPGGGRGNAPPVLTVALSVIVGENKFSQTTIAARPGQHVELTFTNTDDMQHNVVIFKKGDMAAYEKELIASMNDPRAQSHGYIPESPSVLFSLPLVTAHGSGTLSFDAPTEPGEYPFVCSFPGHWVTMRGVLRVE